MLNAAAVMAEKSVGKGEFLYVLVNSFNQKFGLNADSGTCGKVRV